MDNFISFQKDAEKFLNAKIVNIKTHDGLEFVHKKFSEFLNSQVIKHERINNRVEQKKAKVFRLKCNSVEKMLPFYTCIMI